MTNVAYESNANNKLRLNSTKLKMLIKFEELSGSYIVVSIIHTDRCERVGARNTTVLIPKPKTCEIRPEANFEEIIVNPRGKKRKL